MSTDTPEIDIRIGTLVRSGMYSQDYIRQILPHGFESFSLVFWQSCEDINFRKLAKEVNAVLDDTGAVISSLGIFGNPLENIEREHTFPRFPRDRLRL